MKNTNQILQRSVIAVLLTGMIAMPAYAGFEWNPPPAAPAISMAPQNDTGPAVPAAPAADVDMMELTPIPGAPEAYVDPIDSLPPPVISQAPYETPAPAIQKESASLPAPSFPEVLEAPASSGPFTDTVGFGSDIPLALAMGQIVPSEFAYSFASSVNPGLKISWNGGKPWNEVLNEALSKHDLRADVAGKAVIVRTGAGAPRAITNPMAMPLKTGTSSSYSTVPHPPADAPMMTTEAMAAVKGEGTANYPRRTPSKKTFLGSIFTPEEEKGNSAPRPPVENQGVIIKNEVPPDEMSSVEPVAREAAAFEPAAPAAIAHLPSHEPVPLQSQKISYADEVMRDNAPPLNERPLSDNNAMGNQANVLDPFQVGFWQADNNQNLREVLQMWADKAGVEVIWDSGYDYKLPNSISMHGTFPEAVTRVFSLYGATEPRPQGKLHPNLPQGPSVLLVENFP